MHMNVLLAWMYMHGVHAWCLQSPEEGARSLGTGIAGAFEPVCVGAGKWTSYDCKNKYS